MSRNITEAFGNALSSIWENGDYVTTRGQKQVEILSQLIKIDKPKERVLIEKYRNNNIFALIAETMWVMAGRDDLKFLCKYLPRAVDFSDDNLVWRAAYGPRLRNWRGIDQFKEIARLINEDKNTKRAVMIIYDPEKDYIDTKDVPCNNWLHFMCRDGKLNLDVTVRANDAIWGFGGINTFEWSVLHEMMAYWTGCEVGRLSWFVSTLHIYERHFDRSKKILKNFTNKSVYDFKFNGPKFSTPIEKIDDELARWFDIENKIGEKADLKIVNEINKINDEFLRNSLYMIYIYNRYLNHASKEEIISLTKEMDSNDFKIAAMEYFTRMYKDKNMFEFNTAEKEFFEYYWNIEYNDELEKAI